MDELAVPIRVNLNQAGFLGLNEELRCTGFRVFISLQGVILAIELYYTKCVAGLDGALHEIASYNSRYTDENKRTLVDAQGNVMTQVVIHEIKDEDGNVIGTENITIPVEIGVVEFWKMTLGDQYIIPDLQITLESIALKHKTNESNTGS
jgi:hypothetical protein